MHYQHYSLLTLPVWPPIRQFEFPRLLGSYLGGITSGLYISPNPYRFDWSRPNRPQGPEPHAP